MKKDPIIMGCAGIVATAALSASAVTLTQLAMWAGWALATAWLLPACIDALALAAGRVWLGRRYSEKTRALARNISFAALGVSVVGNATGHIVHMEGRSVAAVVIAIAVGSVPPVALAAIGHLMTLSVLAPRRPARTATKRATAKRKPRTRTAKAVQQTGALPA
jgi:hypothetical protein